MSRKRAHTPEEIVSKLRQVEVLVGQGKPVAEAVRAIGVTEATYYLYGRLSHCKQISNVLRDQLQTSIRRQPGDPERPNGKSAHAHLYRW